MDERIESGYTWRGCNTVVVGHDNCSDTAVLTEDEFTYASVNYQIVYLYRFTGPDRDQLVIDFDRSVLSEIRTYGVLVVGTTRFAFSSATYDQSMHYFVWESPGFTWTDGQQVSLRLELPRLSAPANLRVRPVRPGTDSATVSWSAVTGAERYTVQYREAGYGHPWYWKCADHPGDTGCATDITGVTGTSTPITSLGTSTYEVRVQATGTGRLDSPWTEPVRFSTREDGGGGPDPNPVSPPGDGGAGSGSSGDATPGPGPGAEPEPEPEPAAVMLDPGALRVDLADDPTTPGMDERRATYEVVLSRPPAGPVTVTPVSSDPAIAAVSGALTFTATSWNNWAVPQAVTVTGVSNGRVGIAHRISGGGYDTVPAPEVTVVVGDGGGDSRKLAGRALHRAAKRDAPEESPDLQHAPPGALAALARGHLAGLHAALAPRLNAGIEETSHITLAGHRMALDKSLLSGLSAAALDWDAAPVIHGLSWADATGRCASWTTAVCGEADNIIITGIDSSPYGQPAGPWDGLLYNLATGLAGGGPGHSLWRNSGFVLTLGSDTDTGTGRRWTLWGQNRVQAVAGLPAGAHHESELRSGWLGLDTTFGNNTRMGLALSRSGGQAPLRAVHPYLTWSDGITTVSALGGFGKSSETDRRWHRHTADEPDSRANIPADTSAVAPATALTHAPLRLQLGLVEMQRQLGTLGGLQLGLRADAAWASLSAGEGSVVQTETVRRLRAGLDAGGSWQGIAGLTLTPSLQAHLRSDTGDGTTGRGLELAGGLHAAYGLARLTVQGRMLTARGEATTRERGLETTLSLGQPGSIGLSLSLSARWGDAAVGGDTLWQEQLHYRHHDFIQRRNNAWSLDARAEHGLVLPGGVRLTGFGSLSHDAYGPRLLFGLQRGHPAPAR